MLNKNGKISLAESKLPRVGKEKGYSGITKYGGIAQMEMNHELFAPLSYHVYDEMRRTDGTVSATLLAATLPIRTTEWDIEDADETPYAKELGDFARRAMFKELRAPGGENQQGNGFNLFIVQALKYLQFGVMPFEKIYKVVEGKVYYDRFAFRHPQSILKWELKDGRPGITQQVLSDEVEGGTADREIPMEDLLLFVNDQEGTNYEGISILRAAYFNWFTKSQLIRIDAIAAERFGLGIPVVTPPENASPEDMELAEEIATNIRAHEEAHIVWPSPGWTIEFISGGNQSQARDIMPSIRYHNIEIARNILAQFLVMDDVGSNARSENETDFFLKVEQAYANYLRDTIQACLDELVVYNYGDVAREVLPKLTYKDFKEEDLKQASEWLANLSNSGMLTLDLETEKWTRRKFGIPELTPQMEKVFEQIKEKETKDILNPPKPVVVQKPVQKGLKENKKLADQRTINMISRETQFLGNISEFEREMERMYSDDLSKLEQFEGVLKEYMKEAYRNAKKDVKGDGIVVLSNDNERARNLIEASVAKVQQGMKVHFNARRERYFKTVYNSAKRTYSESVDRSKSFRFSEAVFDIGQFNSFMAGHVSNMEAFINDEGRRFVESAEVNFGGNADFDQVMLQVDSIRFNRNTYSLSDKAHMKGYYNATIVRTAQDNGLNQFKMLMPRTVTTDQLDPFGGMASNLFLIHTFSEWAQRMPDKNANPLSGLGMHHNSPDYYYPIYPDELEEETMRATEQRADLRKKLNLQS